MAHPTASTRAISVVIPYKQRLANLRCAFRSLSEQTMSRDRFEVVVGALEYDPDYLALCAEFSDRLEIVSVLDAGSWNTSRARNRGIRQATGEVVVLLDADIILGPEVLETLHRDYFGDGGPRCVLGQVFGYDEGVSTDVVDVDALGYEDYRDRLAALSPTERAALDDRWSPETAGALARYPWAFSRTALMALPLAAVREHDLYLDEGFLAWGAEDQEWGLRIVNSGIPLVLGDGVYGLHLPHRRDLAAQDRAATLTNRYYLAKWPSLGLELALSYRGWTKAHDVHDAAEAEVAAVAGDGRLGVVRVTAEDGDLLLVGARLDADGLPDDPEVRAATGPRSRVEALPLLGLALPYDDGAVERCLVLDPVLRLPEWLRERVFAECGRVALTVSEPATPAQF